MSGKKKSGGQPAFSRLSSRITNLSKHWFKKLTARSNRRNLHQSLDIENHRDKPLNPRSLD